MLIVHSRAMKILEKPTTITWDYDEEADVLYLSGNLSWLWGWTSARGLFCVTIKSVEKSWGLP